MRIWENLTEFLILRASAASVSKDEEFHHAPHAIALPLKGEDFCRFDMWYCDYLHSNIDRCGVIAVTTVVGNRLHVESTGNDSRVYKQERSRTMKRQIRLNLTALFVALPMVLVAATTAISYFP